MISIALQIKDAIHQGDVYPNVVQLIEHGLEAIRSDIGASREIFEEISNLLIEDDFRGFPIYRQRKDCRNISVLVEQESIELEVQKQLFKAAETMSEICITEGIHSAEANTAWHFLAFFGDQGFFDSHRKLTSTTAIIAGLLRQASGKRESSYLETVSLLEHENDSCFLQTLISSPFALMEVNSEFKSCWFDRKLEIFLIWHFWCVKDNFGENAAQVIRLVEKTCGIHSLNLSFCWNRIKSLKNGGYISQEEAHKISKLTSTEGRLFWSGPE